MSDVAPQPEDRNVSVFHDGRIIARGPMAALHSVLRPLLSRDGGAGVLIFEDATGRQIDPDFRVDAPAAALPARGRPKLGVVAKEVTLLPRHWDWLAGQPGGASGTLRRLVEDARKTSAAKDQKRAAQEAAFRFMNAIAGNFANFEDVLRALYADDPIKMQALMQGWPGDVASYALALAFPEPPRP
jgi:hypothetical protein